MGFGKDGKGIIISESREIVLGSLAANSGLIIGTKLAMKTRFRMLKGEVTCTIVDLTNLEGGGLELYLADGNLTLVEFEAAIEQNGPIGAAEIAEAEKAMRPTWLVGGVPGYPPASSPVDGIHMQGKENSIVMDINPRWTFGISESWNWIAFNTGKALTTGSTLKIKTKVFGVWVT